MFPTITRIYSNEQRLQHEYCTTFLSLPTIYHDLCNLKITKFIIFQFLSIGAVARHKTFFLNFFISSLRISCFVQCPQSPSSSSLIHQVSLCFFFACKTPDNFMQSKYSGMCGPLLQCHQLTTDYFIGDWRLPSVYAICY